MLGYNLSQKLISIILTIILVLSFSMVAFADEVSEIEFVSDTSDVVELPDSALLSVYSDDSFESTLNNELRNTAQILAASSTRSVDDIYNLLYNSAGNYTGYRTQNSFGWALSTQDARLWNMFHNFFSSTDNIGSSYIQLKQFLDILNDWNSVDGFMNSFYIQNNDIISKLNYIHNQLETNDGTTITNVASWLKWIEQELVTLNRTQNNINTHATNMEIDLFNFYDRNHSDLTTVNSSITSGNNQNHTDINTLNTNITGFRSEYNNINWLDWLTVSDAVFSDINMTIPVNSVGNYTHLFFKVTVYSGGLCRVLIPFRPNTYFSIGPNIKFYDRGRILDIPFSYDVQNIGTFIIFDSSNVSGNSNITFEFNPCFSWYLSSTSIIEQRIDENSFDGLLLENFLTTKHIDSDLHTANDLQTHNNNQLDKLVRMYASDDELSAKEAQASVENQSLSDFTGSGSAAASVGNVSDAKGIQNTVKNGLNTGGSVSNGLSIFNNDSSFWGWFSSDCASWFTTENNRSLMKTPIYNPDDTVLITTLPDIVGERDNEYYNLLGGDVK